MHQALSLKYKMAGLYFRRSSTQKVTKFVCFLNIPVSSSILTYLIKIWCIVFTGNRFFFSDEISLKTVSAPFVFLRYKKMSVRGEIVSPNTFYILHIYK